LYLRFALSDVEDLMAEGGVTVSYATIRRWVKHFEPISAPRLRGRGILAVTIIGGFLAMTCIAA